MIIAIFITILLAVAIFLYSKKPEPQKLLGVYSKPGKWYPLKCVAFFVIYTYNKYKRHKTIDPKAVSNFVNTNSGVNIRSPTDLDQAQHLSDHPKAFDAIFFIGTNSDGFYVVVGCERRQMGTMHSPIYIGIPGKGLFCLPQIPDTLLFGGKPNEFGAEGLLITPVEPMKRWTIAYEGKLRCQSEPSKLVDVKFEAEWIAKWKYFNFETDLYPLSIVRSIAREPWSREYFENLKRVHQTHYEQFGMMFASFSVDGVPYKIKLQAFRDHSFGHKRDWELMHRYAFHHIFLENGLCASVGVICQPSSASVLKLGVVCYPNGDVKPVKWCDLQLYQHGENGIPPKDYAFSFAAGHRIFTVQVMVEFESEHFVGKNWDARMVERFTKYTMNGVPGRGVSEFHYKYTDGRPESISDNDPIWYQKLHSRM